MIAGARELWAFRVNVLFKYRESSFAGPGLTNFSTNTVVTHNRIATLQKFFKDYGRHFMPLSITLTMAGQCSKIWSRNVFISKHSKFSCTYKYLYSTWRVLNLWSISKTLQESGCNFTSTQCSLIKDGFLFYFCWPWHVRSQASYTVFMICVCLTMSDRSLHFHKHGHLTLVFLSMDIVVLDMKSSEGTSCIIGCSSASSHETWLPLWGFY